jgi:hypothetical protein
VSASVEKFRESIHEDMDQYYRVVSKGFNQIIL